MIAFYTSASDEHGQIQCMAYSNDNGRTYTKYEKNPVLTPFDGLKDFRDPKVFWYEPAQKWYMIVSADKEMRFYSSSNLKDWEYLSGFGKVTVYSLISLNVRTLFNYRLTAIRTT